MPLFKVSLQYGPVVADAIALGAHEIDVVFKVGHQNVLGHYVPATCVLFEGFPTEGAGPDTSLIRNILSPD